MMNKPSTAPKQDQIKGNPTSILTIIIALPQFNNFIPPKNVSLYQNPFSLNANNFFNDILFTFCDLVRIFEYERATRKRGLGLALHVRRGHQEEGLPVGKKKEITGR
jgi:hypothetical protein